MIGTNFITKTPCLPTAKTMIADRNNDQLTIPSRRPHILLDWKLAQLCCHTGCKLLPHFFIFQCLPFNPTSHGWLTKIARSRLPGDQLTIQHLVSLVQHIKKQVWRHDAKIYHGLLLHTWSILSILVNISAEKKYSWCGVRCYNRAATNTFRSRVSAENFPGGQRKKDRKLAKNSTI